MQQQQATKDLRTLAEQDQVSAPLARLQLIALRAMNDPTLATLDEEPENAQADSDVPALHGRTISIDTNVAHQVIKQLHTELRSTIDSLGDPQTGDREALDPVTLLTASISWDSDQLELLATQSGIEEAVLTTLGHIATIPVLNACRSQLDERNRREGWDHGYCPFCGAWPLLVEMRGLHRQKWSRCGRCASEWQSQHMRCVYCDNTDHTTLGYFAPEAERESRRALTCDKCHGFVKAFATVSALSIDQLLHHDLSSLELDVAAMDNGYGRPDSPGFRIELELEPKPTNGRKWLPWR